MMNPTDNFEIYVFSGLGGALFDSGTQAIEAMIDAIKPTLSEADHVRWQQWNDVANSIIARSERYGKPTVILIGMSRGAKSVVDVATRLRAKEIDVKLLIGIDPTAGYRMEVPRNVHRTVEFWSAPRNFFERIFDAPYGARQAAPNGSRGGKYVYPLGWGGTARTPINIPGGHIHTASDVTTHAVIKQEVTAVLNEGA